jgi:hypothetical protein
MAVTNAVINADDRFAIEQLLSSYGVYHDARDFVRLETCFTDDATYVTTRPIASWSGHTSRSWPRPVTSSKWSRPGPTQTSSPAGRTAGVLRPRRSISTKISKR